MQSLTRRTDVDQLLHDNHHRHVLLGYFPTAETELLETFRYLPKLITDIGFEYTMDPHILMDLIGEHPNPDSSAIYMLTIEESKVQSIREYKGELDSLSTLQSFVHLERLPFLLDLTSDPLIVPSLLRSSNSILILILGSNATSPYPEELSEIGEFVRNNITHTVMAFIDLRLSSDLPKNIIRLLSLVGIDEFGSNGMCLLKPVDGGYSANKFKRFRRDDADISVVQVGNFFESVQSGFLPEFTRSTSHQGIHGTFDMSRDEFIHFTSTDGPSVVLHYVPWCSRCIEIENFFKSAAANMTGIRFGRLDASKNDIAIEIRESNFPSIVMYHGGMRIRYQGIPESADQIGDWLRSVR